MRRVDDRGQVLAYTVIWLLVAMALAGLAIDGGFFVEGKRRAQTAADAAAMAGAAEIWKNPIPAVTLRARASATLNGFTDGTDNAIVTVNNPPAGGSYAGNNKFVEVIVSQQRPTMLLPAIGVNNATFQARAVAGPASPLCLQTLNVANTTISFTGPGTLSAPNCTILADSLGPNPITTGGLASVTAGSIGVVANSVSCNCNPAPDTGILAPADPLAGLPAPAPTLPCISNPNISGGVATLSPGTYCGIRIAGGANVTFQPGTYILYGTGTVDTFTTGLKIGGAGTVATGTGVTFYFMSAPGVLGTCNTLVNIAATATATLTAPTSGTLAGVLFFQDANVGVGCGNAIASAATSNLTGVLYFPSGNLIFAGGATATTTCTEIVAGSVQFAGPSVLNSNCSDFFNAGNGLISAVALAE